jgi:ubiquinone/menaquinone biosynthesis C-methylase UbiE
MLPPTVPDFNLIAPVYDALAQLVYGKAQQKAQAHFLSVIPIGARVLVLGGGSGWILTELLQKSAPAYVLYLEPSTKMLQKAKDRFAQTSAEADVEFRLGTEADLLPPETFHVVLTPFVLDLFTPEEALAMMKRLSRALRPNGLWLHTDFHAVPAPPFWQKALLWGMYRFFRLISHISAKSLPPFDRLFQKTGFETQQEAFYFRNFIRAQVLQKPLAPLVPSP